MFGAASVFCMTACGPSADTKAAMALSAQADSAMQKKDYALAVALLDSLNKAYPLEVDIRRTTGARRIKAVEGMTLREIPQVESRIAMLKRDLSSLEGDFVEKKPTAALPGYLVYDRIKDIDLARSGGVQPRVNMGWDAVDMPWVLAYFVPRGFAPARIVFEFDDDAPLSVDLPEESAGTGVVNPMRLDGLLERLESGAVVSAVVFEGNGKTERIKCNGVLSEAVLQSSRLAGLQKDLRASLYRREHLETLLQTARDKAANAVADEPAE